MVATIAKILNQMLNLLRRELALPKLSMKRSHIISKDYGLTREFKKRTLYVINSNYLMNVNGSSSELKKLEKKEYVPSYEDILRTRMKTPGILSDKISLEGYTFEMLDVGGQRNERKKWVQCSESVSAIVFVAALNEYDQLLYEDNMTNRLHETLNLFGEICSNKWFQRATLILFLNKDDLFREKIKSVDLKVCFPDYEGGCNYDSAMAYLKQEFNTRNESVAKRKIYSHITCAIVTKSVSDTFASVRKVIINASLHGAELLS